MRACGSRFAILPIRSATILPRRRSSSRRCEHRQERSQLGAPEGRGWWAAGQKRGRPVRLYHQLLGVRDQLAEWRPADAAGDGRALR